MPFARSVGHGKGRQADPAGRERVRALIGRDAARADMLVEYLHRVQDAEGGVSVQAIAALAAEMRLSQAQVFEVASFYHHFDLLPDGQARPPLTVRVCESLSCSLAGAPELARALDAIAAARGAGGASGAGGAGGAGGVGSAFRVQRVPCVGRCDRAPVAVIGRYPVENATPDSVRAALDAGLRECPVPGDDHTAGENRGPGDDRGPGGDGSGDDYASLRALASGGSDPESILSALEASGLRGMGGAGFPAARKWRIVAAQAGPRMLVVNADEGEPGTFKDRFCLERSPRRFLEGMLIAARVVGCDDCFIYLRDEYAGVRAALEREIESLRAAPPIDAALMPAIDLRRGAGAYICGEESALIESIEGKRGMPRLRPPYVAEVGLFGRPTLVNNVETLYWVPEILARGAQWFASQGRNGRAGMRLYSVSGRVRSPGVKRAGAGITLRELIDEHCGGMLDGHRLYAYLPGGASGGILAAEMDRLALDFDTLQPHGCFIGSAAIIVLSQHDRARDAALNLMRFFRDESCGQCTPCRAGTAKAAQLLEPERWDAPLLRELAATMGDASICGLGQAAPNPVLSVLARFAHEVDGSGASVAGGTGANKSRSVSR